jgi:ribonuclease P protein component
MLPRENRLVTKEDFNLVKEKGTLLRTPFFLIIYFFRKDNKPSRFGFIVSTKVSKRAVDRNRIKRLLRDSIRILISEFKPGYDILFIAYKNCLSCSKDTLFLKVKEILKTKGLLK